MLFTTITFVSAMCIKDQFAYFHRIVLEAYVVVHVHKNVSSAKRRLVRHYPPISTPLFPQFNLLHLLYIVAIYMYNVKIIILLVLAMMSIFLGFVLSQMSSRNPGFEHDYDLVATELPLAITHHFCHQSYDLCHQSYALSTIGPFFGRR